MRYCFKGHPPNFKVTTILRWRWHGWKTDDLALILAFLDANSNSNLPMATEWHTWLLGMWKRFPVVFRSHPSNFNVAQNEKSTILELILGKNIGPVATIKSLRFALLNWTVAYVSLHIHCNTSIVGLPQYDTYPDRTLTIWYVSQHMYYLIAYVAGFQVDDIVMRIAHII